MTLIYPADVMCAVCGNPSTQFEMLSSSIFGLPDLDTRPAPMMRDTMYSWIQHCPACGYCDTDISKVSKRVVSAIRGKRYQKQLYCKEMPDLANRFLCQSILCDATGKKEKSAWACLYAAWDCDDKEMTEAAAFCRKLAAEKFTKANVSSKNFSAELPVSYDVLLTDIYRRAGRFNLAAEICETGIEHETDEMVIQLLRFERNLIKCKDDQRYNLDDAGIY